MRSMFGEYYRPTDEDFENLWSNCTFTFDANVLLGIYRYTPKTQETLLEAIDQLKDRIWIPHQVAYEYHENRLGVIFENERVYEQLHTQLERVLTELKQLEHGHRHPFINELSKAISPSIDEALSRLREVQSQHPNLLKHDTLLEKITILFSDKVGPGYSPEKLTEVQKNAQERYDSRIPPGFKDAKTKSDSKKYGDVVLWFQIMDYAQENQKSIIHITNETKEDWWLIENGQTVGPRRELRREFMTKTKMQFYMYSVESFTEHARSYFNLQENKTATEEMRLVRLLNSSNLRVIGYNYETRELEIEFQNGDTYLYDDVPISVYEDIINSKSAGKFFYEHIKDKYPYHKLVHNSSVTEMVNWFFETYEDPVHAVPYESKEGGYIYYNSGPYDAQEVLQEKFFNSNAREIDAAVKIISQLGNEWVKIGQYP